MLWKRCLLLTFITEVCSWSKNWFVYDVEKKKKKTSKTSKKLSIFF